MAARSGVALVVAVAETRVNVGLLRVELVRAAVGGPWPLDLETGDREVDAALRTALFQSSSELLTL